MNNSQNAPETEVIDIQSGEVIDAPTNGSLVKYEEQQKGAVPYHKVSEIELKPEQVEKLLAPVDKNDVEIRPDGIIYLPEIKYRRTLNRAIGPGKWALVPRNISLMENKTNKDLSIIAYNGDMYVNGSYMANATGEQKYHHSNSQMTYATACEAAKSDCMVRCCKDLGIASELWDPRFIESWKKDFAVQVWCEGVAQFNKGNKKQLWRRKDMPALTYPWKEQGSNQSRQTELPKQSPEQKPDSTSRAEPPKKDLFADTTPDEPELSEEMKKKKSAFFDMLADLNAKWPPAQLKAFSAMWKNATTDAARETAYATVLNAYQMRTKKAA